MVLLEIAAQGIRGFAPAAGRLALRPGYVVVACDGAVLRRLLAAGLLVEPGVDPALAGAGGAPARIGVTLTGDDGTTWRLVRDLAGACQLQRFDPARRAFQSVEQDPRRAAELLRAAGVPGPGRLASLLSLTAADLPSRQPSPGIGLGGMGALASAALASAALAPASGAGTPAPRRLGGDEARRKLQALGDELARARKAEDVQGRLDAAQARLFKLEEMLKSGGDVHERLSRTEAAVAALETGQKAQEALGDPPARLQAFQRSTARRDEVLGKLREEREARHADAAPLRPLVAQPGFLAGSGVAAVALLAGAVSPVGALALAAIPAAGWAAFDGLRWVGRAEAAEQAERRDRVLADRERKAVETWERETTDVRAAVVTAGVGNVGELAELLERFREAQAAAADARAGLADWEARAETKDAEAERARVQQEIGELEHDLTAGTGGFTRDVASIEAEMARVEAAGDAPEAPAEVAPARPTPAPVTGPSLGVGASAGDPLRSLVERGSAELGVSPGTALRAMQQRVAQLLPPLSAQRLSGVIADERGNLQVQSGGRMVAASMLPPPDRDLLYVVLKLGFLEQAFSAGAGFAVFDDALSVLPEVSRRLVARVLKQVAKGRQILHGTQDPSFREAADHAA